MIKLNGYIVEDFEGEYLQKAKAFCDKTKTSIYINYLDRIKNPWGDNDYFKNSYHNRYNVLIKRNINGKNKQMTIKFTDSIHNTQCGIEPNIYDILACITKDDPYSFEDFCANYGYDTDSRKAYKTYLAVEKEWANVERVFGDVLEELQEIL